MASSELFFLIIFIATMSEKFSLFVRNVNVLVMKKSILVLLFGVFLLTSCAQYTCPTYSKAPAEEVEKEKTEDRI